MTLRKEFGDFQTPPELALQCMRQWERLGGWIPELVIEPSCGVGAFVAAAAEYFSAPTKIVGVDIRADYAAQALLAASSRNPRALVEVHAKDFFQYEWEKEVQSVGRLLVIGNPPWVTSSVLGSLNSNNLPAKSNFQRHRGLDALTGKANFDISEWMLLKYAEWLAPNRGAFLVLCKTSVARKAARAFWRRGLSPRQAVMLIDSKQHFGVSVEACLYMTDFSSTARAQCCDVFSSIEAETPQSSFGIVDGALCSDVEAAIELAFLSGRNAQKWRSGVKHDCSSVLELRAEGGRYSSGVETNIDIEPDFVFPLAKSSDVNSGSLRNRHVLLPQTSLSHSPQDIEQRAPKTWRYLNRHSENFERRASRIYKDKPAFSIFGVGEYTLKPWKLAIAALYKTLDFKVFSLKDDRPIVFDDTVYFLSFDHEAEARTTLALLSTSEAQRYLEAHIFWSEKRPITTEVLNRLDLSRLTGDSSQVQIKSRLAG